MRDKKEETMKKNYLCFEKQKTRKWAKENTLARNTITLEKININIPPVQKR